MVRECEERIAQLEARVDHLIEANKRARKSVPKDALYSHIDWLKQRLRECQAEKGEI
jgi:predicted transcriptional regulator